MIGAAVGGLAGAIWADRNNDGVVDGYVYNGQYYPVRRQARLRLRPRWLRRRAGAANAAKRSPIKVLL